MLVENRWVHNWLCDSIALLVNLFVFSGLYCLIYSFSLAPAGAFFLVLTRPE